MPRAMLRSSSSDAVSSSRAVASSLASWLSGGDPVGDDPQDDAEADEPLLGAVVEVALELAAGGVAGLDDPGAARPQIGEPRAQVGLQALVLERDPGRRGDRADQLRLVAERRVVQQRGDLRPAALDERRRAAVELHRPAVAVDVGLVLGHPVGELQRRVAQRLGQRVAQRAGRGRLAQLDQQVADRRPGQAGAQQAGEEDHRDGGEHDQREAVGEIGCRRRSGPGRR